MGEVADMMLDGTLCEGCGVFLNADAPGYPCYCLSCKKENGKQFADEQPRQYKPGQKQKLARVKCRCGRWISPAGMQTHLHHYHTKNGLP